MQKDVGSARLLWSLLKEDRKPILLGLACGTAMSALVPQLMQGYVGLASWLLSSVHVQKIAGTFFIGIIAAATLLLWLIPISVK